MHKYVLSQSRYTNCSLHPKTLTSSHDILYPISLYEYTYLFSSSKNSRQAVVMHKRHGWIEEQLIQTRICRKWKCYHRANRAPIWLHLVCPWSSFPISWFHRTTRSIGLLEEKKILTFGDKEGIDDDGRALRRPWPIVEVVEATAEALVKHTRATECKRAVIADREPGRNDGASLRRSIELELVVGSYISRSACLVLENTILKCDCKWTGAIADNIGMRYRAGGRSGGWGRRAGCRWWSTSRRERRWSLRSASRSGGSRWARMGRGSARRSGGSSWTRRGRGGGGGIAAGRGLWSRGWGWGWWWWRGWGCTCRSGSHRRDRRYGSDSCCGDRSLQLAISCLSHWSSVFTIAPKLRSRSKLAVASLIDWEKGHVFNSGLNLTCH